MLKQGVTDYLQAALQGRHEKGRLRSFSPTPAGIDFCSNDYLGFAGNTLFQNWLSNLVYQQPEVLRGAGGARLISGDSRIVTEVENFIAQRHRVAKALLLPSGYVANLSLFSALPVRGDTIILDERVHRSVHDGCLMSPAKRWKFRHNDVQHLRDLIERSSGRVWIAVESLYSMDGDFAPLSELTRLAQEYNAALIVDEAHAIGTFGLGLLEKLNLQKAVFASVVTYGKAMGLSGAAILGSGTLVNYLANYASPVIYSTALSDFHALAIRKSYEFLDRHGAAQRKKLDSSIAWFNALELPCAAPLKSPIKPIRLPDITALDRAVLSLQENGIRSYAIKSPTVSIGQECVRISLHAFNNRKEIELLGTILKQNING
ncbi:pyridoxal phosphate-dependent aminotransferase family protein [Sphingobacterium shayense]|uniref:aminotransferase class I/II-fold pyridoxal phosphate-dependent enzyme n=1 Tax=Sphingobacterium shayense TaxID=626343 RepID=UPI0015521553|nr:pyridoxal phosphate-dependent aminotransferase family protein [Sphingobacterium shayense]NQD70657.1 pyridoxal phosphate-dependent aminotransferase family protein [Sphingobacterium shayense]